jgi:hypothetical protein
MVGWLDGWVGGWVGTFHCIWGANLPASQQACLPASSYLAGMWAWAARFKPAARTRLYADNSILIARLAPASHAPRLAVRLLPPCLLPAGAAQPRPAGGAPHPRRPRPPHMRW